MAESASTTSIPDDEHQSAFLRTFLIVLGALIAFTLFCAMVARMLSGGASGVENDPILKADVANRIAPVASVRTSADAADADASTVAAPQTGEQIVQGACAACHLSGVAGAPKLDDDAAWATRREAGLDGLLASVINGKGAMPARAGTTLSDDELKRAVAHMAGIEMEEADSASSGTDSSDEAASAESTDADTSNTEAADGTDATAAETESTDSATAETETAEATTTETSSATETATATATSTATSTATTATAAATTTTAAASTVQNDGAADRVAGPMTARVKTVADGICAACHLSGVGGAPKIGDKDAWAARAEKGLGGMVAVVAAGQGAMPARGGSDLSDEEIATAIVYLMEK